jgi:shikimate kinase
MRIPLDNFSVCKNVRFIVSVKLKKSVALLGLPGVGKSAMADAFSRRTGVPVRDIDSLIEASQRRSIPALFASEGEAAFRRYEYDTITQVLQEKPPALLALGGGAFAQANTRALLKAESITVWLKASLEDVLHRIKSAPGTRPLLAEADPREALHRLARTRAPFYAEADIHLDLSGVGIAAAVESLYATLQSHDALIP